MIRLGLLALALLPLAGCFAPKPLPGMGLLETAQTYLDEQRYDDAAEAAEWLLEEDQKPPLSAGDEAEAAWIAGESRLALEDHEKAFKHFKRLLETAPWSPHAALLERRFFDIGMALLYDPRYDGWVFDSHARGVEVMTALQVHFRRSDLADDALRHVADYFASDEEWLEASLSYEQLFDEYPDSEWAERALWLAAHMRLRRVYRPGYDHGDMWKAHELLQTSRRVHPRGSSAREAKDDLVKVRELLAATDVMVADFYAGRGQVLGEQLRLANAALMYPETSSGLAAAQRLVAFGLDVDALAGDPRVSSVDSRVSRLSPWEEDVRP